MLGNVISNETSKIKRHILQNILSNGETDTQTTKTQRVCSVKRNMQTVMEVESVC